MVSFNLIKLIAESKPFRHVWFTDGYIELGLIVCLISIYFSCKLKVVLPCYLTTGFLSFASGIAISIQLLSVSKSNNPLEIWPALTCMGLFAISFILVLLRRQDTKRLHAHLCATLASIWFLAAANYRMTLSPTMHGSEKHDARVSLQGTVFELC